MKEKGIYKKLLEVQKEVGAISKDSTNPFFNSEYFDINGLVKHVNPILSKNGLVLLQPISEGKQGSLIVDSETGEQVESWLELPKENNPQKLGSCITYYRRYTLCSLLGLQAGDDDANLGSSVDYKEELKGCKNIDELVSVWGDMPAEKQEVLNYLKEELKLEFTNK
jgi:hypothetical protein